MGEKPPAVPEPDPTSGRAYDTSISSTVNKPGAKEEWPKNDGAEKREAASPPESRGSPRD
jgi:hypothetical protein